MDKISVLTEQVKNVDWNKPDYEWPEIAFFIEGVSMRTLILWRIPAAETHLYFRKSIYVHQVPYLGLLYTLCFAHWTPSVGQVMALIESILQAELDNEGVKP